VLDQLQNMLMTSFPDSIECKENELLSKYTYYRIGGCADLFCTPRTREDLIRLSSWIRQNKISFRILGAGSNILVSDKGFRGLVVCTRKLNSGIQKLSGPDRLRIGSGMTVASFLGRCSLEGWGGFEFLAGVPGSMGGVAVMNAGTYLGEASNFLCRVEGVSFNTGSVLDFSSAEMVYEYRRNDYLPKDMVIDHIEFLFQRQESPEITKKAIDSVLKKRKVSQPVDQPSCGSVFKNPKSTGFHAWQVVEKLGLIGHRIGNAQVSKQHGNFIVNLGGATSSDVKSLIDLIKGRAEQELGILLEEEVKYFP